MVSCTHGRLGGAMNGLFRLMQGLRMYIARGAKEFEVTSQSTPTTFGAYWLGDGEIQIDIISQSWWHTTIFDITLPEDTIVASICKGDLEERGI